VFKNIYFVQTKAPVLTSPETTDACVPWRAGGPYLVSLLAAGDGAGERLLVPPVHAHGAEDGLGADGAFCGPRLIAVRLLVVYLLLVILAAWRHDGDTENNKNATHPR